MHGFIPPQPPAPQSTGLLVSLSHKPYEYTVLELFSLLLLAGGTLLLAQLVEALHYQPEGRGFDSRCYHWNFSLT
jgi:hypothetical protein